LVVWSSESSDVAESQWMSPGCKKDLAFLLAYTEVGAHLGVMLAAGMPLSVKAGLMGSSVSAIAANVHIRMQGRN